MFYLCFSLAVSLFTSAHPVTFQGGAMLKSMAREDMSENSVTYTFHRQWASGLEVDRFKLKAKETTWGFIELNHLLHRWNGDDSQANIYLLSGAGGLLRDEETKAAYKWGLQVDYETRQFYTLAAFTRWGSSLINTEYALYRIGFAPYVAGYDDLNIWAILQLDYNKDMRSEVQVTPFLRFYFKNILWEIGSSLRGNFYWQFMVHL